jgi:glucose/mannose transport system substrate-binding protein
MWNKWLVTALAVVAIAALGVACGDDDDESTGTPTATGGSPTATGGGLSGDLEIFSWWTTGGEAAGKEALFDLYPDACSPDVNIIDATVAGGGGAQARQVLTTRMQGGDPPGSFQVHMGHELIDTWVTSDYMQPLDDLFEQEGFNDIFPQGVLDIVSYEGHPYSVPVNIHRANVLWYNKTVFEDNNIEPPVTFEDFFAAADTLEAAGITPLALGDSEIFASTQLLETTLIGSLGADAYNGLWTGETDWASDDVTTALENYEKMLSYVNDDHSSLTWDQANDLVIGGDAAMTIMGDWLDADNQAKNFADSGWIPSPGTTGIYDALSDTFGLPKDAPNEEAVMCWLGLVGSKEGQEAFNPLKGSVCARTDCDPSLFDEYLQDATADWQSDEIVPSLAHGAAASPAWLGDINDAVTAFITDQDVGSLQSRLADACVAADVCS